MKLYPVALLDQFTTSKYLNENGLSAANAAMMKRISDGTIDPTHPITLADPNHLTETYHKYLLDKDAEFASMIDDYAKAYLAYNQESFNTFKQNSNGYMDGFYDYIWARDLDTINFVTRQRKLAEAPEEVDSHNPFPVSNRVKPPVTNLKLPVPANPDEARLVKSLTLSQRGNGYDHFNLTEDYIQSKKSLIRDQILRRVHISFLQRFPFDLAHVKPDTAAQLLEQVGGDIDLFRASPFAVLCSVNDQTPSSAAAATTPTPDFYHNVYRKAADIEFEQFERRHNLESCSWLRSICSLRDGAEDPATSQTPTTNTGSTVSHTPPQQQQQQQPFQYPPNPKSLSTAAFLTHSAESNDILEAIPTFAQLCEKYKILESSHSYQWLMRTRINIHNSLRYLRDQLMVIDSIPIQPELTNVMEPYDLYDFRRAAFQLTLTRDLLRQPILDFNTQFRMYHEAKSAVAQMNGVEMPQAQSLNHGK